jgi:2-pyrone-4,6-dicarboxylate lactonase
MAQDEIPVCSPPDRNPRKATLEVPPGSVDCHTHVFGPVERYPYSPNRGYTPPDSSLEQMLHMHAMLGIERVVLTQPSVYGIDNAAILEAMTRIPDRARAVVALDTSVTDDELARLEALGARGVRLNLDNKGGMPMALRDVRRMADRIKDLGWHYEFLIKGEEFDELEDLLRSLPIPISIGHMAYMPHDPGIDYPPFQRLLNLIKEGNTWMKLSAPNRISATDLPPYDDVVPMGRAFVETMPERMLWGTDWPHPNKFGEQPNDADLLEQLALWAPDPAIRKRILVDNPETLYRF